MTPEQASVCSVGAALNWSTARPPYVDCFHFRRSIHNIEFHCLQWNSYTLANHLRVFLSNRCLVNEDVFPGNVAIDETVFILYVKSFDGATHTR